MKERVLKKWKEDFENLYSGHFDSLDGEFLNQTIELNRQLESTMLDLLYVNKDNMNTNLTFVESDL